MICYRCQKDVEDVHTCTPAPFTREEIIAGLYSDPNSFDMDRMRATALQAMDERDRAIKELTGLGKVVVKISEITRDAINYAARISMR